ncbi:MAG: retropepsin-like domain-containing protein [Haliscomenobacter sp.]|nr:pepsin/retropepsin-like aspartic protease family protein [Haliscomenobacter sp.]MBK9492617.1 retropepsin-like domain-containing protein [Haliscomenobacter sp.]
MTGLKVFCVWVLAIAVTVVDGQSRIAYVKTQETTVLDAKEWSTNSEVVAIPFQFSGTNILLEAELSNQKGLFILDTGAPTLIINEPHPKKEVAANGVNAAFDMENTVVKLFKIDKAEWKNIPAYALDLQQLESSNKQKLLGLIGYSVLKKHELLIAPKEHMLYLLPVDESLRLDERMPLAITNLVLEDHLPIIEVKIEGHTWRFGIDTGAESNLISEKCLSQLTASFYEQKGINNIRGLDKITQTRKILRLQKIAIGGLGFVQVDFTEMNFDHLSEGNTLKLDGIIGSDLLSKMKFSLNYRKKNFKIWEKY